MPRVAFIWIGLLIIGALAVHASGSERVVMPGDRLLIVSERVPWLCVSRTVQEDGTVELPALGSVPVATRMQSAVASRIALLYGSSASDVVVELLTPCDGTVRIDGAVRHPLELRFRSGTTLKKMLELAEPLETADPERITIVRGCGAVDSASAMDRVRLGAGDRVFVPVATSTNDISVVGGVTNPSMIRYRKGMTLSDAIGEAGGIAARGDATRIQVVRGGESVPLSLPADSGFALRPGETVQVTVRLERHYVVVQGAVAHPGLVEFAPGMNVSQAIEAAGGPLNAAVGSVTLHSGIGRSAKRVRFSLGSLRAGRGADPILEPDDVIEVAAKGGRSR